LRIGNWYNQFGNEHQVDGSIIQSLQDSPDSQIWCKPIPLTEEWLLKFGFTRQTAPNNLPCSDFGRFRIYWPSNSKNASLHFRPNETEWFPFIINKIEYVHQLQNLYFALTGEELTLIEGQK